ncbi:MAG: hypothetical protein AMJ62_01475 [Myxococcales bacterium SG8_38]|nr:MAG: hypothetical protein AMJ62_01475 [Myxococcales bacterium SG8_38]
MTHRNRIVCLAWTTIVLASALLSCSKSEQKASKGQPPIPSATHASIDETLSAYEKISKALTEDDANVRADALDLARAAKAASATAPASLLRPLEELSAAAQRMGTLEADGLGEARAAFGDVSRAMISLLSAAPSLQEDLHVYECPMAKGYKKWVQREEGISNPYMGREMPKCGTEAHF